MARYNKIYAGPVSETLPQVQERKAPANAVPGRIVVENGSSWALAGTTTVGKVYVLQDNYLAMKGVDDAYTTGDTAMGMEMLDEHFFNVRVATGNNVTRGAALTPAANGELAIASTSDMVVAFAEEAYNNTSGSGQLVRVRAAKGYLTAAA
jgi:hypothetical protein